MRIAPAFEHARRRRIAAERPSIAVDVEDGERRTVERVVIARRHVTDVLDVLGQRLQVPDASADAEAMPGQAGRGAEEKLVDARLAIGEAIGEHRQVAEEPRLRRDRVVGVRIDRVVDRGARPCPQRPVRCRDGVSPTVREHQVEGRHERAQRVGRVGVQALERRRHVHVPIEAERAGPAQRCDRGVEPGVERADAPGLHDHVGPAGVLERARGPGRIGGVVDHHARPRRLDHVAGRPVLVGRLEERDAPAAFGQRVRDATVAGDRAVPRGRRQARAEERQRRLRHARALIARVQSAST
jgi:hypothetical protein